MQKSFTGLVIIDLEKLKGIVGYVEKYTETENERKTIIQQIMTSIDLFAREVDFDDESINAYFIFDKLNDLLKSIDTSIQSTKYDLETRKIWKERLQSIFLGFSIESLEELHQDINEDNGDEVCPAALS